MTFHHMILARVSVVFIAAAALTAVLATPAEAVSRPGCDAKQSLGHIAKMNKLTMEIDTIKRTVQNKSEADNQIQRKYLVYITMLTRQATDEKKMKCAVSLLNETVSMVNRDIMKMPGPVKIPQTPPRLR